MVKLRPTPDERFEIFHRDNPGVYELFVQYAEQARGKGMKLFSAGTILDLIRWEQNVTKGNAEFKVNNDFAAPMARKLIREDSTFAGFFE